MDEIRVGIIGLGGICRERHLPGFRKIEGVEIRAVVNRSRESSEKAAAEWDIPEICDTWEDITGRDDIDAVLVGTWPYMHHRISIAALGAGKHVFCQARMAMDAAEAVEMRDAARDSGRIAMLCPVPIGLSVDDTIRRLLREDRLGPVRLVRVQSLSGAFAGSEAQMTWRKDHRFSGLNALTLGMYAEVIHRWFGPAHSVSAQTQLFLPERVDATGQLTRVEIPDQILFSAGMADGVTAQYAISGVTPYGRDAIEIHGGKAALYYDVGADRLYWMEGGEKTDAVAIRPEDAYDVSEWRVEQDFISAIREGREYHPDFEDGLRYMQVVQAVYDSARENRVIKIPAV